jgi:hypothetical protein
LVPGNGNGNVLEIVLAGATNYEKFLSHSPESYPKLSSAVNRRQSLVVSRHA